MNSPRSPSPDSGALVKVDNVSKIFCRDLKRSLWYGLKDSARELLPGHPRKLGPDGKPILRRDEFWANQDISFELHRGECLGLIGHNGAGKTTLLKMLNGLMKPDAGSITMRGRVGAIIALGAGFNPILTGRENVYIAASILGLTTKEITNRLEEIIDFADLEEFIDTPVQNYSSGMQVRLGFSIAISISPDILLIDEVLAVGDATFRNKCYSRLGALKEDTAVILVSHNMNHVLSICNKGVLLEHGKMNEIVPVEEAIQKYQNCLYPANKPRQVREVHYPLTEGALVSHRQVLDYADSIVFQFEFYALENFQTNDLRIVFYSEEMSPIMDWWSKRHQAKLDFKTGNNRLRVNVGPILLKSGTYYLNIVLCDNSGLRTIYRSTNEYSVRVKGADSGSPIQLPLGDYKIHQDSKS